MFYTYFHSPLGSLLVEADQQHLLAVSFVDQEPANGGEGSNHICDQTKQHLLEYFDGTRQEFTLPLKPRGTAFQQRVWQQLLHIPFGHTSTYAKIAALLQNPLSVRAVGSANGQNPIAIIIPCHRVIGVSGDLIGYAGGLWRKEKLLALEGYLSPQTNLF